MAWFGDTFGDGLSNLKGQITKITKEVLSDDPLAASSFEGRIKELEKQCSEYLTEIETLRKENKRLKEGNSFELTEDQIQQICEYENRLTELTAEKTELTHTLDRIEEQHQIELETVIRDRDDLRGKLMQRPNSRNEDNNKKNDELSVAFGNLQLQSDLLFEENKSKDCELRKYYEDNERLKKVVAELELRLEQQSEKAFFAQQSASNDIEVLKQMIHDLEETKQDDYVREQLDKLSSENSELKEKLETVQSTENSGIDVKSLEEKLQEMQIHSNKLEMENDELKTKLSAVSSLNEKIQASFKGAEKEVELLQNEITALKDKNHQLETSAQDCLQLRNEYEEKLNNMATLVQRTEERENLVSGSLASEIRVLKTLVSRIRSEFLPPVDPQTENQEEVCQTDDVKRLLQDVSQMTEIIKTINQGLSSINLEKVRLEKEMEVLKTLSAKTEHELSVNVKAKQQLEANVLEWAAAVTNRDEMIKNLSAERAAFESQVIALGKINQDLGDELKASQGQIEELTLKLSESVAVAEEWKTRLDGLQAIYANDTKRHDELNKNKEEQLTVLREGGSEDNDKISRLLDENSDLKALVQQLRENIFAMNTREVNNKKQHRRSHSQAEDITSEPRYQALVSENQSLAEKESNLRREVERLRAHLVEVEDHYTEQAMTTESQLSEYRAKLSVLEDQLRNSSNVYKSANVRSSQQVEALQTQINLMDVQRRDLQSKLSDAEDHSQKQAAALASLQLVLEQFQLDKKRELQALLDKHAYQIELERRQVKELENELDNVRQQLTEAKNGLKAALRLGEQLEKKTLLVNELQEELLKSKELASAVEKQLANISQSTAGKIDKAVIKNLVVGYLSAQGDHKTQALKILSSVLELTQEERTRAGIEGQHGWFSHLLSPGAGSAPQGESLSKAFVQFLENESRPQPQLKLLPETVAQAQQRRTPLVFSDLVLPSVSPTPVSDNGLGQVLKDS